MDRDVRHAAANVVVADTPLTVVQAHAIPVHAEHALVHAIARRTAAPCTPTRHPGAAPTTTNRSATTDHATRSHGIARPTRNPPPVRPAWVLPYRGRPGQVSRPPGAETADSRRTDQSRHRCGHTGPPPAPGEDPSAALAARYVAASLGVQVDVWDTCGRQGVYDLRYEQQGRVVAVEAKSIVDYDFRLMGARIARSPYVPCQRLGRLWVVDLRHGGDVRLARDGLPDVLEQLETRGWHDQHAYRLARWAGLADELDRLAVTGMRNQPPTARHPPGFVLHPEPWGAWQGAIPDLATFVSNLLADETSQLVQDLRRQLNTGPDVDERHAFLLIGWEHVEGWPLMWHGRNDLPSNPRRLPTPIDGVWLAGFSADTRVVAWLPGVGWVEGRNRLP